MFHNCLPHGAARWFLSGRRRRERSDALGRTAPNPHNVCASGCPVRVEFDQAVFVCSNQELLAAVHIEFAENAGEVMAHGRAANVEAAGDVFIGQALSDQGDDVMLTFCEVLGPIRRDGDPVLEAAR